MRLARRDDRRPRSHVTRTIAAGLAVVAIVLHAIAANRYGFYRDELYFIACAHHLAWGYPDQPPFVAVAAWLAAPAHYSLVALRAFPILASGGAVAAAVYLAREFGGNRIAAALAGVLTLLMPTDLFLGSTLTTTSLEPLTWTLVVLIAVRLAKGGDARWWYAAAGIVGLALYMKYTIVLLAVAMIVGLLVTPERRVLASRHFWLACVVTAVIALPNLWWQLAHGAPFLQVIHGDVTGRQAFNSGLAFESANVLRNAGLFLADQLLFTNPFIAPVWILGLVALLRRDAFARVRFVGIGYLVLLALAMLLAGRGYYIAGIYPVLVAAGCVSFARPLAIVALAAGVVFAPMAFPLLTAKSLIAYQAALFFPPARQTPPRFVQPLLAEEWGWDELAQHVAAVYAKLPPATRAKTTIFADTYGDAGALNFYGPKYGLPPVVSGQNAFYDWGPGPHDGSTVIAVGASQQDVLRSSFRHVQFIETYLHPNRWSAEGPDPIWLCTDPVAPLQTLWPRFKWYGA